jgi:flagellin
MSLISNTNVTSLIAQRNLNNSSNKLKLSMERLSSGYRINRASDDAAGLSMSQNLTSEIRRMQQASRNVQDSMSVLDTADGALSVIIDNFQRVRELTVQAGNDTNDATARASISNEIRSLMSDIDRISTATQLNGINLLNGTATQAVVQIGSGSNASNNVLDVSSAFTSASSAGLGAVGIAPKTFANTAAVSLTTGAVARNFLFDVDSAIQAATSQRARIGAFQNQLSSTDNNLNLGTTNFMASNSRIRDVDVATESSTMAQSQVLTQAATMVLSQTNELPKMILSLLQQR